MGKQSSPLAESGRPAKTVLLLALAAAIMYNSWVVGLAVDARVVRQAYFSALSAPHRPYNWLFILTDCMAALLVMACGAVVWRSNKQVSHVLLGYWLFALATIADATIPIVDKCSASIAACGIDPGQVLNIHAAAGLLAIFALLWSLYSCNKIIKQQSLNSTEAKAVRQAFFSFILTGLFFVLTIVFDNFTAVSQGLFLLSTGFSIVAIPLFILEHPDRQEP